MICRKSNKYSNIQSDIYSNIVQVSKVKRNKQTFKLTLTKLKDRHGFNKISTEECVNRLVRRCQKYLKIQHKNIERIVDVFVEEQGRDKYIGVIGQIDTEDLFDLIASEGFNHKHKIKTIMLDVISGLQALHELGLIYHNLSLGNIQKNRDGDYFQLRFGCFKEIIIFNHVNEFSRYSAPEVVEESGFDIRADIWSLGVLFIQLIRGEPLKHEERPYKKSDFPSKQLLSSLPNGEVRSLLRDILKRQAQDRVSLEEVRRRVNVLDLSLKDDLDQEEIQEKSNTFNILLPLIGFDKNEQIWKQAQDNKNITFQFGKYIVNFKLSKRYDLLKVQTTNNTIPSNKLTSIITSQQITNHIHHFTTLYNFFQTLAQVSYHKLDIMETGELRIGFPSKCMSQTDSQQEDTNLDSFQSEEFKPESKSYFTWGAATSTNENISTQTESPSKRIVFTDQKSGIGTIRGDNYCQQGYSDFYSKDLHLQKANQAANQAYDSRNYLQALNSFQQILIKKRQIYPEADEIIFLNCNMMIAYSLVGLHKFKEALQEFQKIFTIFDTRKNDLIFLYYCKQLVENNQNNKTMLKQALMTAYMVGFQEGLKWRKRVEQNFESLDAKQVKSYAIRYSMHDYYHSGSYKRMDILKRMANILECPDQEVDPSLFNYYFNIGMMMLDTCLIDEKNLAQGLRLLSLSVKLIPYDSSQHWEGLIVDGLFKMMPRLKGIRKKYLLDDMKKWIQRYMPEKYGLFFQI